MDEIIYDRPRAVKKLSKIIYDLSYGMRFMNFRWIYDYFRSDTTNTISLKYYCII